MQTNTNWWLETALHKLGWFTPGLMNIDKTNVLKELSMILQLH